MSFKTKCTNPEMYYCTFYKKKKTFPLMFSFNLINFSDLLAYFEQ